jgi:hypothetical protein
MILSLRISLILSGLFLCCLIAGLYYELGYDPGYGHPKADWDLYFLVSLIVTSPVWFASFLPASNLRGIYGAVIIAILLFPLQLSFVLFDEALLDVIEQLSSVSAIRDTLRFLQDIFFTLQAPVYLSSIILLVFLYINPVLFEKKPK